MVGGWVEREDDLVDRPTGRQRERDLPELGRVDVWQPDGYNCLCHTSSCAGGFSQDYGGLRISLLNDPPTEGAHSHSHCSHSDVVHSVHSEQA